MTQSYVADPNLSLKENILSLRNQGAPYKAISETLGCAKSTVSFHCAKMKGHAEIVEAHKCAELGKRRMNMKPKPVIPRVEINPSEYQEEWIRRLVGMGIDWKEVADALGLPFEGVHTWCDDHGLMKVRAPKISNKDNVQRRKWRLKALSVAYKGGCCSGCGFDTLGCLTFHHRDPEKKDFQIGGNTPSWSRTKTELDKCDLLCRNCHREVHELISQSQREKLSILRAETLATLGPQDRCCKNVVCSNTFPVPKGPKLRKLYCSSQCSRSHRSRIRWEAAYDRIYEYKGTFCLQCGYDRSRAALDFHHRDPKEKDFRISAGFYKNWEVLKAELDKCDLLCANCHQIEHGGFWC